MYIIIFNAIIIVPIIIKVKLDIAEKEIITKKIAVISFYNVLFTLSFVIIVSFLGWGISAWWNEGFWWLLMWIGNAFWALSCLIWIIINSIYNFYKTKSVKAIYFIPPPFFSISLIVWMHFINILTTQAMLGI